jgi:nucleoside-diphosphate-sugar epimerase
MSTKRADGLRLLVTGATGFLGRHVVRAIKAGSTEGPKLVFWDRNRDGDFLNDDCRNRTLDRINPNTVLHLAWRSTGVPEYEFDRANRIWTEKTVNMLERCKDFGISVLLAGSVADSNVTLTSEYSKSKAELADYVRVQKKDNLFTLLRFSYLFSVVEERPRVLRDFVNASKPAKFNLYNPQTKRDYLAVKDAAIGVTLLLHNPQSGFVNVSTGTLRSTAALLLGLVKTRDVNYTLTKQVLPATEGPDQPTHLSKLGWSPVETNTYFSEARTVSNEIK